MEVQLDAIGKRYGYEWIFQNLTYRFDASKRYALTGHNGSGKSTLLQILAGNFAPSKGTVQYTFQSQNIDGDDLFKYVSLAAPYLELIEEFNLEEVLKFHFKFKKPIQAFTPKQIIEILDLKAAAKKNIYQYSSGMKQRVKLGLAILSDCPLVLLDEPATNLDTTGIQWYKDLIQTYHQNRLFITASNRVDAYDFCDEELDVVQFKET